jgi:putative spermidine/putrescine transport system permease protein
MRHARTPRSLYVVFIAVLAFMIAPLVIVVINAFNSSPYSEWPPKGFSLHWFDEVFSHAAFRTGFGNSLVVGVCSTAIALVTGAMAAYALTRYRIRAGRAIRISYFAPLTVPRVAIGFALFALFISTRSNLYGTVAGLVLAHSLLVLPFVVTIFAATIGGIDPALEEAARDLGANPLRTFVKVTLPQMRTGFVVAALFAFITSFDELETSIFLVRPSNNTLPVAMFLYLEQQQTPALAALSTLLIAFTLAIVLLALPLMLRGAWQRYLPGRSTTEAR